MGSDIRHLACFTRLPGKIALAVVRSAPKHGGKVIERVGRFHHCQGWYRNRYRVRRLGCTRDSVVADLFKAVVDTYYDGLGRLVSSEEVQLSLGDVIILTTDSSIKGVSIAGLSFRHVSGGCGYRILYPRLSAELD